MRKGRQNGQRRGKSREIRRSGGREREQHENKIRHTNETETVKM